MAQIVQALREEIGRVARRELKTDLGRVRKDTIWLKKNAAELKRRLTELERENRLLRAQTKRQQKFDVPSSDELQKMRITGKQIRSLRERLGISQADLGVLVGVSGQSVYQWERKDGSLRLRENTKAALKRVRTMGKREILAELEQLG